MVVWHCGVLTLGNIKQGNWQIEHYTLTNALPEYFCSPEMKKKIYIFIITYSTVSTFSV